MRTNLAVLTSFVVAACGDGDKDTGSEFAFTKCAQACTAYYDHLDGCGLIAGPVDKSTCVNFCDSQASTVEAWANEKCDLAYEGYIDCAHAVDWSVPICDEDNRINDGCEDQFDSWSTGTCVPCEEGYARADDGNCCELAGGDEDEGDNQLPDR